MLMRLLVTVVALAVSLPAAAQDAAPASAPIVSGRFTYQFGLDYMLQVSGRRDYPFRDETFQDDETFAWWRLRPRFAARSRHVDFVIEGQDTHSTGGSFSSRKAWLDLLNAYVDVKDMRGWSVKVGRQQGDLEVLPRMVRTSDFAAIVRSFDVAEVSWQRSNAKAGTATDLRAFVFKPVDNLPSAFNRQRSGELLWTLYARRAFAPGLALQSYVIARHNREVLSETGIPGRGAVYAWQALATGPTPAKAITWTAESVVERGHASTDDVRAWALFLRSDAALPRGSTVDVRYTMTSGDETRGDGVRGEYDTFYAASSNFGSLGQVRGVNVRAFTIGGLWAFSKPVTLNWRYFNTRLHNPNDVWYGAVIPNISRPDARSAFIGQETNLTINYRVSPRLLIRAAYHRFYPAGYVADAPHHAPHEFRLQIIGSV